MRAIWPIALCVCVMWGLALRHGAPASVDAEAFWAAAAAPSTLYTPLSAESEEPAPTAWCDGQGKPACSPAAPVAPQQHVTFSSGPSAVLLDLRLAVAPDSGESVALEHVQHAREGVRSAIERPPRA